MSNWKNRLGVLYSTNPDYEYQIVDSIEEVATIAKEQQKLRVQLSKKHRAGKEVSLITGFVGSSEDLEDLGKLLKQKCGVGGAVKDGEILIQGNQIDKLLTILKSLGYTQTKRI